MRKTSIALKKLVENFQFFFLHGKALFLLISLLSMSQFCITSSQDLPTNPNFLYSSSHTRIWRKVVPVQDIEFIPPSDHSHGIREPSQGAIESRPTLRSKTRSYSSSQSRVISNVDSFPSKKRNSTSKKIESKRTDRRSNASRSATENIRPK